MLVKTHADQRPRRIGAPSSIHRAPMIPVLALGLASSLFLAISFVLCVLGYCCSRPCLYRTRRYRCFSPSLCC
jgi:hypothetical protein